MKEEEVVITFTTIPSRMEYTIQVLKNTLPQLSKKSQFKFHVYLHIPWIYTNGEVLNPFLLIPLKILESKYPFFHLNTIRKDLGPITKLIPLLDKNINDCVILIMDDNQYDIDSIINIAKHQSNNKNETFTYYTYEYNGLIVPQGVDMISFWSPNLNHFIPFWNQVKDNEYCKHVDDLVIAKYCHEYGIQVRQLSKGELSNVWEVNPSETVSLFNKQGKYSRDRSMKECYNFLLDN